MVKKPETMENSQREIREAMRKKSKLEKSDISKFSYLQLVINEPDADQAPLSGPSAAPQSMRKHLRGHGVSSAGRSPSLVNVDALARDESYWGAIACLAIPLP
ncbi:hypothetical protein ZIOFF_004414 [Zingiber officinale]|uniref:Uncharacterized protein n=1 Tax=Zingiber officinale TaxID=94328 RepID=A0A8J5MAV0_ZINOF|nr:hypothetical protein ZIOFF_004414 [Zingiber officinale]